MEQLCQSRDLEDLPNEIWKPIEGHEGYYEISNYGRVKSLERYILKFGKILKLKPKTILKATSERGKTSYIFLQIDGIKKNITIAREVYRYFSGDSLDDHHLVVCIDNNLRNYHINNLKKIHTSLFHQQVGHARNIKMKNEFCGIKKNKNNTFRASINIDLGTHRTPEEAARAYDTYIIKNGLNRKTNFDRSEYSNII